MDGGGFTKRVWCVFHREGSCATKSGNRPAKAIVSEETLCGYVVTLPYKGQYGRPGCPECLKILDAPEE